jgi:sulfopyruvate decarboxylase TPP-binding subunit
VTAVFEAAQDAGATFAVRMPFDPLEQLLARRAHSVLMIGRRRAATAGRLL